MDSIGVEEMYRQLHDDGALPSNFSGVWVEDKEEFMKMYQSNLLLDFENIIDADDYFYDNDECDYVYY